MSLTSPPMIAFRDVRVEFPRQVVALGGVSLEIERGEFAFLVGPTGSGKSTLLKLLTRELKPTAGEVLLNGRNVGQLWESEVAGLRREMGIVPQDFALLPQKKVWENVAYAMRAIGRSRREVRREVPEILEQVGIALRADAYPHQLSGGEQQRVAIARALINRPPLLLADEPTGNLDPERSMEIMQLLKTLNLKGTTVVVASHDLVTVQQLGKRIVAMRSGKVESDSGRVQIHV
jgi:cell division transport system ATP-binding protein